MEIPRRRPDFSRSINLGSRGRGSPQVLDRAVDASSRRVEQPNSLASNVMNPGVRSTQRAFVSPIRHDARGVITRLRQPDTANTVDPENIGSAFTDLYSLITSRQSPGRSGCRMRRCLCLRRRGPIDRRRRSQCTNQQRASCAHAEALGRPRHACALASD